MTNQSTTEMSPAEINEFLGMAGTGVLALAKHDSPYATPISYGYDKKNRVFYFRLGSSIRSGKTGYIDASSAAQFVVYDQFSTGWKSVIATGELVEVTDEDLTSELAHQLSQAELPLLDIWPESLDEINFSIYQMNVNEITGRKTE